MEKTTRLDESKSSPAYKLGEIFQQVRRQVSQEGIHAPIALDAVWKAVTACEIQEMVNRAILSHEAVTREAAFRQCQETLTAVHSRYLAELVEHYRQDKPEAAKRANALLLAISMRQQSWTKAQPTPDLFSHLAVFDVIEERVSQEVVEQLQALISKEVSSAFESKQSQAQRTEVKIQPSSVGMLPEIKRAPHTVPDSSALAEDILRGLEDKLAAYLGAASPPLLVRYQGNVGVDILDESGTPLDLIQSTGETHTVKLKPGSTILLEVVFDAGHDYDRCRHAWQPLRILDGAIGEFADMEISIDCPDLTFSPPAAIIRVPCSGRSQGIIFRADYPTGLPRTDVWVQIYQKNRLLQVSKTTLEVKPRKNHVPTKRFFGNRPPKSLMAVMKWPKN